LASGFAVDAVIVVIVLKERYAASFSKTLGVLEVMAVMTR
jgi:hypothetical protein